jgi:integrase-like protein
MSQQAQRARLMPDQSVQTSSPKLLDRVRAAIRARHYSLRTEEAYVGWVRRFILFHHKRHPAEMGEPEINQFLTHLAVAENVAASTQNQALSAILFLYQEVLGRDLDRIEGVVWAKKPKRLPVVLTRDEVRALFSKMSHSTQHSVLSTQYSVFGSQTDHSPRWQRTEGSGNHATDCNREPIAGSPQTGEANASAGPSPRVGPGLPAERTR